MSTKKKEERSKMATYDVGKSVGRGEIMKSAALKMMKHLPPSPNYLYVYGVALKISKLEIANILLN